MKIQEIEFKLTEKSLKALFEGKKIVYDYFGKSRVTIYPPSYGVFMTHEKMQQIKQAAYMRAWDEILTLICERESDEVVQKS